MSHGSTCDIYQDNFQVKSDDKIVHYKQNSELIIGIQSNLMPRQVRPCKG